MDTLIRNSNLRFTGAYVTGPTLPSHQDREFPFSTRDVDRGWLRNLATLRAQGWGLAFFYVGHSMLAQRLAASVDGRERGTLHGRHLRTTLNALGPSVAGSVVFIDNEDSESDALSQQLINYYDGLFAEMSRPDPELAAFRPGMYGHGLPLYTMIQRWPELFLWDVRLDHNDRTTRVPPFDGTVYPLLLDVNATPTAFAATPTSHALDIRPYPLVAQLTATDAFTWPLGRQFRFYDGAPIPPTLPGADMPPPGSLAARRLNTWRPERTWDFNVAFVRNPAFPSAMPRIAAVGTGTVAAVIRGRIEERRAGTVPGSALAPRLALDHVSPGLRQTIAGDVDADAPIFTTLVGGRPALYVVLANGAIAEAYHTDATGWSALTSTGAASPLRALRAFTAVERTIHDVQLFYADEDHALNVRRRSSPGWSTTHVVLPARSLHPFSTVVAAVRGNDIVNAFFIDWQGRLATAVWATSFGAWPGFRLEILESVPSCHPATALAVASPNPNVMLVFAIGRDGRLRSCSFTQGAGWSPVRPAGVANERLGQHSRLSALVMSDQIVEVAALSDSGSIIVYRFQQGTGGWAMTARTAVPDPPNVAMLPPPTPSPPLQPADGCRINPYGDVVLIRGVGGSSVVVCSGLRSGVGCLLLRDTGAAGRWLFVTE